MSDENHTNAITLGTYTARATRWHWDTPKSGTGMCLALMLCVEGGPHTGKELRGTLYFDTEKADAQGRTAADRSIEALRSMGLKGALETITDEGGGGLGEGLVSIKVEFNEKGYPFAKYINPATTFTAFAPPPADTKRAFFAQMNARLKVADAGARAAGARPTQPAPQRPAGPPRGFAQPAADDTDIPF